MMEKRVSYQVRMAGAKAGAPFSSIKAAKKFAADLSKADTDLRKGKIKGFKIVGKKIIRTR